MRAPLLGLSQRCTATYLRTIAFGAGSGVGVALLSQHRAGLETAVVVGTTLGLLGSLLLRTSAGASRAKGPRAGVPRSRDEYRGVSFERPPGAFSREATEQRQTAASLGESEDRYRDLFENATAPIATLGLDDRITEVNDAFARLLGYRPDEMVGTHLNSYLMPTEIGVAESQLERKLSGEAATTGYEQQFVSRTGRRIILEVETRLLYRDGVATGTQGICHDITAQREAETELRQLAELNHRLATYDALTGLPNRASFHRAVTDAIAVPGSHAVVLHLDVDRFKQVNDTLGHESGDRLLTKIATCLRDGLDDRAMLARLAGDEFGILITGDAATIDAICDETVTRLEANLREPLLVQGLPLLVEASIGIARHPADGLTADLLLQRADIAVDQAKKDAHGHAYFRLEASPADTGRLQLLSELRRALDERELIVHYQPKIDLVTGSVRRVEALVRWQHPTRGLVPPNDFVEAAEQTSLIGPLTLYVVESAVQEIVRLRQAGIDIDVAVNLSARNLGDSQLPNRIAEILERHRVRPERLVLEVTESAIVSDAQRALEQLHRLADMGVKLAVDDFGSGYTSLASLQTLPIDHIKIDQAFISDIDQNPSGQAIVRAIVNLAHDMGLEVVAEGIDTAAAEAHLRALNCDIGQGFYYSPALAPPELEAWLKGRRSLAAVA